MPIEVSNNIAIGSWLRAVCTYGVFTFVLAKYTYLYLYHMHVPTQHKCKHTVRAHTARSQLPSYIVAYLEANSKYLYLLGSPLLADALISKASLLQGTTCTSSTHVDVPACHWLAIQLPT